jgi:hypothetical protein
MWNLYGIKTAGKKKLVAMFDSEQQLRAYVNYATLKSEPDGTHKFEQKTALASYTNYEYERAEPGQAVPEEIPVNPTPTML